MSQDNHKQLREAVRLLERKLGFLNDTDMACCGVTMAQCHAVVEIGRAGILSLRELADLLGLDNSTASRTLNNLVNRELAQREISENDRRYVAISLTESGKTLFQGIEERMNQRFLEIQQGIPEGKREQVLESLQLLLDALGQKNCC